MSNFLTVLPMAVVMTAGPQIVSAVLLATSENPRRNSVAFLTGVTLATVAGVTLWYFVAGLLFDGTTSSGSDDSRKALDWVVVALLVVLAIRVYLQREHTEPPAWMKRLQEATPRFSFRLGFLLFLLMPTDVITVITVGTYLARHDLAWWKCLPFVAATMLLAGIPLLILVLMGRRAATVLPRLRDWMTTNSWIVSEVVILFFLVLTLT